MTRPLLKIFLRAFVLENRYDIVVAGAGHAGVESALSGARAGLRVLLVTLDVSGIARLSCNPAIGGLAKGHLVKEIDALGGIMGRASDLNTLQMKTLNKSKGRAVWSSRAQIDKMTYPMYIKRSIDKFSNIEILEDEVINIVTNNNKITGVKSRSGLLLNCSSLIVTAGTFMNGVVHIGRKHFRAGRMGEKHSSGLTEALVENGFRVKRLKTGTPPRISKKSIDLNVFDIAPGDAFPQPFSINSSSKDVSKNMNCYIAQTNPLTHDILNANIELSAIHQGNISGAGPRYCPSIEDKVVRFKDRNQHQLFLEQEWENSDQLYINGFSTSMPESVQKKAIASVDGLKSAVFIRPGYAIEYDYFPTSQLKTTLESKNISGLFLAGQLNGTSGYEEAAAQGLIAGINASCFVLGREPLTLKRSESYIGVLIDDLTTQDITEPYRMFTSSAEHRLWLRPDNAYSRLYRHASRLGLLSKKRDCAIQKHLDSVSNIHSVLSNTKAVCSSGNRAVASSILKKNGEKISRMCSQIKELQDYKKRDLFAAETDIKYEGYVKKELARVQKIKDLNDFIIPKSINYNEIKNLSSESKEKLASVRPETLGQASRVSGVRQSDISVIATHITKL